MQMAGEDDNEDEDDEKDETAMIILPEPSAGNCYEIDCGG